MMDNLDSIKSKIYALHSDGRSIEQITSIIKSEHYERMEGAEQYLTPIVREIVARYDHQMQRNREAQEFLQSKLDNKLK